jgi:hypothetical protein
MTLGFLRRETTVDGEKVSDDGRQDQLGGAGLVGEPLWEAYMSGAAIRAVNDRTGDGMIAQGQTPQLTRVA